MPVEPRPYPYETWPRIGREDAMILRRIARRLPLSAPEGAAAAVAGALGAEPRVRPTPLGFVAPGQLAESVADPLVAVVLAPPEPGAARVAVELDPRLAACVIDRALGGEAGPEIAEPSSPLGDVERGVLAFVAARTVARSAGRPWRVAGVVTSPAALAYAVGDAGAVVWAAEVELGADRGAVRAWVPDAALRSAADDVVPSADRVARLPLSMVVEGGRGNLGAEELAELRPGDVVVLDESWLAAGGGGPSGEARLRVAGSARTAWQCRIEDDGITVVRVDVGHDAPSGRGRRMKETDETSADRAVQMAGDAPVEVTIELARFTMPLEELAALRPGEVVVTGRPIGETVVLRAGGRAVAEGELVDVDGEVGVRLLALGA